MSAGSLSPLPTFVDSTEWPERKTKKAGEQDVEKGPVKAISIFTNGGL
jgi:hypothetical protein